MMDTNEHIGQPLLSDDRPSWVTMENDRRGAAEEGISETRLPWDRTNKPTSSRSGNDDGNDIPKVVILMRVGNMFAAGLLLFVSVGNLTNLLSISNMVLGGYGVCFGCLICCLEVNVSFLRQPIASNFGFLYNPFLRLLFYLLMAMVAWSFDTLVGKIACATLIVLSFVNTYVICRYPGYRGAMNELAEEEEKRIKSDIEKETRTRMWRHAIAPSWMNENE